MISSATPPPQEVSVFSCSDKQNSRPGFHAPQYSTASLCAQLGRIGLGQDGRVSRLPTPNCSRTNDFSPGPAAHCQSLTPLGDDPHSQRGCHPGILPMVSMT